MNKEEITALIQDIDDLVKELTGVDLAQNTERRQRAICKVFSPLLYCDEKPVVLTTEKKLSQIH